jgi:hypothetical protein
MLACRGVAAADMAARLTFPQLDPARSFLHAFFTGARRSRRRKISGSQFLYVFTRLGHGILLQVMIVNELLAPVGQARSWPPVRLYKEGEFNARI